MTWAGGGREGTWEEAEMTVPLEEEDVDDEALGPFPTTIRLIVHRQGGRSLRRSTFR